MKYAFMNQNIGQFPVTAMSKILGVSRSGFYDWRKGRPASARAKARSVVDERVRAVFDAHRARYGAPRVTEQLLAQGHPYDEKTVAGSMRRQALVARAGRKFKATTNSNHTLAVAPNLLEQDFSASRPDEKWVQDITYCATDEGWLYLAVVLDLYSRQVVGWAMSHRMKAELVCDALKMALFRRKMPTGVILHSDRGSQYCSKRYRRLLEKHDLLWSMSKRGDCYDNACAETFFHSLKVELTHGERYATRQALRRELFAYIETYYNTVRLHSTLGYVSPVTFEQMNVA